METPEGDRDDAKACVPFGGFFVPGLGTIIKVIILCDSHWPTVGQRK